MEPLYPNKNDCEEMILDKAIKKQDSDFERYLDMDSEE